MRLHGEGIRKSRSWENLHEKEQSTVNELIIGLDGLTYWIVEKSFEILYLKVRVTILARAVVKSNLLLMDLLISNVIFRDDTDKTTRSGFISLKFQILSR